MPDFNRGQMSGAVAILERLGILDLLDGREVAGSDQSLQNLEQMAKANAWQIKAGLGVSISAKDTPIAIAQNILDKCGLSLTYLGRKGARGQQQRYYKYIPSADGRSQVFAAWFARDETASVATPSNKGISPSEVTTIPLVVTPSNKEDTTTLVVTTTPLATTEKGQEVTLTPTSASNSSLHRSVEREIVAPEQAAGKINVGTTVHHWGRGAAQYVVEAFVDNVIVKLTSLATGHTFDTFRSMLLPSGKVLYDQTQPRRGRYERTSPANLHC